jgi:hypothetical protein
MPAPGAKLAGTPLATLGAGGGLGDGVAIASDDEGVEHDHDDRADHEQDEDHPEITHAAVPP